jgi:hypothetical protein
LFSRQLALHGIESEACSVTTLKGEMLDKVESMQPDVVCISALPPAPMVHARYLCKRLHARFPDLPIVVGAWSARGDMQKANVRLETVGCGKLVASLTEGIEEMTRRLQPVLQGVKAQIGQVRGFGMSLNTENAALFSETVDVHVRQHVP